MKPITPGNRESLGERGARHRTVECWIVTGVITWAILSHQIEVCIGRDFLGQEPQCLLHAGDAVGQDEVAHEHPAFGESLGGKVYSVRARSCVLACYNMMIPYLCPELPEKQKEALQYLVKTPLVYSSVALTNWMAFRALGVA
jgi:hypothetical protein